MSVSAIGIDLAKNSFSLHGTDEHGKVFLKKTVTRNKLLMTHKGCAEGASQRWGANLSAVLYEPRLKTIQM